MELDYRVLAPTSIYGSGTTRSPGLVSTAPYYTLSFKGNFTLFIILLTHFEGYFLKYDAKNKPIVIL